MKVDFYTGLAAAVVASVATVLFLRWIEVGLGFQVIAAIVIASGLTALAEGDG